MRLALCQLNLVVGDLSGNKEKIIKSLVEAEAQGAHLALFPELAITSYPAEDLLLKPGFIKDNIAVLNEIVLQVKSCAALVGFAMPGAVDPKLTSEDLTSSTLPNPTLPNPAPPNPASSNPVPEAVSEEARWPGLYNAVAVLQNSRQLTQALKSHLPNYAVFDEHRYFAEGDPFQPMDIAGAKVAIAICEDLWVEDKAVKNLRIAKPDLVAHLNASPYYYGKQSDRLKLLQRRAKEFNSFIAYVNLVGGQDELVFDGGSMVVSPTGEVLAQAKQFEEEILIVDVGESAPKRSGSKKDLPSSKSKGGFLERDEEIYKALVLGTRDYVLKNGFTQVLVGISGGIDSTLVATIAVDALGAENVHGVAMPSRFSSDHSLQDAQLLCANLNLDFIQIPIEQAHNALGSILDSYMENDGASQLAAENIQARIRGTILMALSNINGWLVLTTGNKSENSVGYSTLYGDTAGAFAVIKDLWKLDVYRLAKARNARSKKQLIPERIFTKPPSAELRPDQRDDQSLPAYEILDPILKALVEDDKTPTELIEAGHDAELIKSVANLLDKAEYKRRQVPPGVRISSKAFGKDRRLPITNLYS